MNKALDPANVSELATIAREIGADVLDGPLRYPSLAGNWRIGATDLAEYLDRYRDQRLVVIVAPLGEAGDDHAPYVCGICGFSLDHLGECPRCRLHIEETAKSLEAKAGIVRDDQTITLPEVAAVLETLGNIIVSDGLEELAGRNASWFKDAALVVEALGKKNQ